MVIPVGFAQVNFRYTGVAHPEGAEWTLGLDTSGFSGDTTDIAVTCAATEGVSVNAFRVGTSILSSVLVKEGPNDVGPSAEAPTNGPGALGLPAAPPNTSMLVRRRTALGGRKHRGRIYFPGTADGLWGDGGTMASGDLPVARAAWEDFYNALAVEGLLPVLLHSDATAPTPVLSFEPDIRAATQRRRLRG